ncbi:hypothetical protein AAMO2058_001590200 [Amorphochlora amoebiformis]
MSDDNESTINSFDIHVTVLVPSLVVLAVYHIIFFIARWRFPEFYEKRTEFISSGQERKAPKGLGYLSAWRSVILASDEDLIEYAGFDGFLYIQMQETLLEIVFACGLIGVTVLFPIYRNGTNDQPNGYERYSIGNLEDGVDELWAPVAFIWFASAVTLYGLERNMKDISKLAKQYKLRAYGSEYTVLVENIPYEFRFEGALRRYFQWFYPDKVFAVDMVTKRAKLRTHTAKYIGYHEAELDARARAKKKPKKPPPTIRVFPSKEFAETEGFEATIRESRKKTIARERGRQIQLRKRRDSQGKIMRKAGNRLSDSKEARGSIGDLERQPHIDRVKTQGESKSCCLSMCCSFQTYIVDKAEYNALMKRKELIKVISERSRDPDVAHYGFVTFTSLASAASAAQSKHLEKGFKVGMASEPRDYVWTQLEEISQETIQARRAGTRCTSAAVLLLWTFPVGFVQVIAQVDALVELLPFLKPIFEFNTLLTNLVSGLLPVVALSILLSLVPAIYGNLALRAGKLTRSSVALAVFEKYSIHAIVHGFIITTISGSLLQAVADIGQNPLSIFSLLGKSIPIQARFFIGFVTLRALTGVVGRLLQLGGLVFGIFKAQIAQTEKEKKGAFDPGPVDFQRDWSDDILVWTICIAYATIQPMVCIMGIVYFMHNYAVSAYRIIFMHKIDYETSGMFCIGVVNRVLVGLLISQITIIGVLSAGEGFIKAISVVPLLFITYWYMGYHKSTYQDILERRILPQISAGYLDSQRPRRKVIDVLSRRYHQQIWKPPVVSVDLQNPLANPQPAFVYITDPTEKANNAASAAADTEEQEASDWKEGVVGGLGGSGRHNKGALARFRSNVVVRDGLDKEKKRKKRPLFTPAPLIRQTTSANLLDASRQGLREVVHLMWNDEGDIHPDPDSIMEVKEKMGMILNSRAVDKEEDEIETHRKPAFISQVLTRMKSRYGSDRKVLSTSGRWPSKPALKNKNKQRHRSFDTKTRVNTDIRLHPPKGKFILSPNGSKTVPVATQPRVSEKESREQDIKYQKEEGYIEPAPLDDAEVSDGNLPSNPDFSQDILVSAYNGEEERKVRKRRNTIELDSPPIDSLAPINKNRNTLHESGYPGSRSSFHGHDSIFED